MHSGCGVSFTAGDFCVKAEKKHVKMSLVSLSLCTIVNFSDPGFGSGVVGTVEDLYVEDLNSGVKELERQRTRKTKKSFLCIIC